ncbi:MAG: sugar ABC transporter ATP-binding protein [Vallitaleaceae bacterium]|nr:sugar ABC transporter ATP-binding protein [Vallitaleaceae bacterium]
MFLKMENIVKDFGVVRALDHASLEVEEGEIHGLLGENGAGKSTLMNILAGILRPTEGAIYINGVLQENMTTKKSTEAGIRFIHQELNSINDLLVYENLFIGEEIHDKWGFLNKKTMIEKSKEVFIRMGIDINPLELMENLDTSRKQLVEIGKALLFECQLIIMDEPTTALTNKEIDNLFSIMRTLKKEGVSIIYISHKMPELFTICDRYTVLRDGRFIDAGVFADIDEHRATELLVGRSMAEEFIVKDGIKGDVVYEVHGLCCEPFFREISFDLRVGEVLAITGLHGDGRGELAEALFGARHVSKGEIHLEGERIQLKSIKKVMEAGVGMVPRNRKERSIIKDFSIRDNLSIGHFVIKHKYLFINKEEETKRFEKNQRITRIKVGNCEDYITSLSGGNQQKVVISRWLEIDAKVYILDNPTQGIDVGAKFEIYKIINELVKRGKSVIVFSSEFPEIHKIADRCLIMYKGNINAEMTRDELTEVKAMYYATGANMEGIDENRTYNTK